MNRSYLQKSRNNAESRLSMQTPTKIAKVTNNDSLLNLSNLSVGHMSREGIQRVREKVYDKRGVQMTKDA